MTNGWMNRASDHGKAVPAGAFPFFRINKVVTRLPISLNHFRIGKKGKLVFFTPIYSSNGGDAIPTACDFRSGSLHWTGVPRTGHPSMRCFR